MTNELDKLRLENALLKTVHKYYPVSVNSVVRALTSDDYNYLIDINESGDVDMKTLDRAITRLKADEPYLFNSEKKEGKSPSGGDKVDKDFDAKKAKALEMMTDGRHKIAKISL